MKRAERIRIPMKLEIGLVQARGALLDRLAEKVRLFPSFQLTETTLGYMPEDVLENKVTVILSFQQGNKN